MSLSPSARRVQGALRTRGFGHLKVVELPASTRTAKEAAQAVGAEVGQIVKSLVFVGEKGAYLFLVSGKNRLDLGKATRLVGGPLRQATPEEVRELTGFAIGGVPRWGTTRPCPPTWTRTSWATPRSGRPEAPLGPFSGPPPRSSSPSPGPRWRT